MLRKNLNRRTKKKNKCQEVFLKKQQVFFQILMDNLKKKDRNTLLLFSIQGNQTIKKKDMMIMMFKIIKKNKLNLKNLMDIIVM